MIRFTCSIGLLLLVVKINATKFTDCKSIAQVSKVDVTDCPDSSDVCDLNRGTSKNITIVFTSKSNSNAVLAVVHGVIGGVPLPFPLPSGKSNGCKTGISCPMKTGETYNYINSIKVMHSYPPMDVTVRWELKDDNKKDIVCVEIPCKIV